MWGSWSTVPSMGTSKGFLSDSIQIRPVDA
jgi:hypothetical protein